MPFLSINGLEVPVADGGFRLPEREQVGPRGRVASGSMRRGARAQALVAEGSTPLITAAEAAVLHGMLAGTGYKWSFDEGLGSDETGLNPNAGYDALSLVTATPTPKYGTRCAKLTVSNGTLAFEVDLEESTTWSASFWHNDNNAGWVHCVIVCNGGSYSCYEDAALEYGPSNTPPTYFGNVTFSVSGDVLTFSLKGKTRAGTNATNQSYDDLVIVPWAMSADLVLVLWASTRAYPAPPFVEASGDALGGRIIKCSGMVTGQQMAQAVSGGAWTTTLRNVDFRLDEAEPF